MTNKLHPAAQAVIDLLGYVEPSDIAELEPTEFGRLPEDRVYEAFCPDSDYSTFESASETFNADALSEVSWATDQWSYTHKTFANGRVGICQSALDIGGADIIVMSKVSGE